MQHICQFSKGLHIKFTKIQALKEKATILKRKLNIRSNISKQMKLIKRLAKQVSLKITLKRTGFYFG